MIARIWQGETPACMYDAYKDFLEARAIPDYQSVPGNLGLTFLRKVDDTKATFTLITYWDSYDSIKKFAGEDFEKAKYYPEDSQYLLSFEPNVIHYEVFFKSCPDSNYDVPMGRCANGPMCQCANACPGSGPGHSLNRVQGLP